MRRETILKQISEQNSKGFDFIIIGGGATGLGCAVDAASRGFKTVLVEQFDFGQGASSKSTKLIHGGVRYLEQGNIALVYEALRERGTLFQNAPHIVDNLELLIPSYSMWRGPYYVTGLKLYDFLSGKNSLGSSTWISGEEAVRKIDNLQKEGLKSGIIYHDGQFDDARLIITLFRTLLNQGGLAVNYVKAEGFLRSKSKKLTGILCRDTETGEPFELRAKVIVNATGASSEYLQYIDDRKIELTILASQGSHLVVDKEFLGGDTGLLIPKTSDGRVLFVLPWLGKVVIGTTDVSIQNPPIDPVPNPEEIHFILETASRFLLKAPSLSDIKSVFAGIRPLVGHTSVKTEMNTKDVSRGHRVSIAKSGLISISGGKWTTYRKMAEDTIDESIKAHGLKKYECTTQSLKLQGYIKPEEQDVSQHLKAYGNDKLEIQKLILKNPQLGSKLHSSLDYIGAEVVWACEKELAIKLEDVLARRTRSLFLDARAALESADAVADLMKTTLSKSEEWKENQLNEFNRIAGNYIYSSK